MTSGFALGRSVATGALWMIGMRLAITALALVSTIALARMLTPADFGLVAIATAIVAAVEVLKAFRLDVVLIQNQAATRVEYDTAWSLNLAFTMGLAVVVILAASPVAEFFGDSRLRHVMWALALVAAVGAFENIGVVDFRKRLQFGREFAFNVIRKIAGVCVGLWWAVEFGTYWALIAGTAAGAGTGLVASYLMHPFRPRWSLAAVRSMFAFSKWLMVDNAIYFLRHRSVDFLIGKMAGASALGVFSLAYETGTIANANLAAPIERAVFPGFAKVASDDLALRQGYLEVSGLIALVVVPVAVGIAAIAPLFIPLVLGARWLEAVPLLQVISLASAVSLLTSGGGSVFLAMGRPRSLAWLSGCYVAVLLVALAVLVPQHGSQGASWAFAIAAVLSLPIQLAAVLRLLDCTLMQWCSRVWRALIAATSMYFIVSALVTHPWTDDGVSAEALVLAAAVGAGVVSYVAIVAVLWWASGRPSGAELSVLRFVAPRRSEGQSRATPDLNQ